MTFEKIMMLSLLVFVLGSMASMGLSLTVAQIVKSLSSTRLVLLVLGVNFVAAPVLALAIVTVLPLAEPLAIGILLMSTAAGAPFLPKLAQMAKGDAAASVGIMVLLMVVTVAYLPIVLPLLVGDVQIDSFKIARSLVLYMLLPLGLGLLVRARYEDAAAGLQPVFAQASNVGFIFLVVLGVVVNFESMVGLVGSFGILAAALFVIAMFAIGYGIGSKDRRMRSVMGMGAAQRNISAALVVAGGNFGTDVVTYLLVVGLITMIILMPLAGEIGRRAPTD